ncbi:hypothetical protein KIF24_15725 [Micromonospora sp. Llam7]|uniref:hypothetical protein n=1 Tax=Micromonospora tarapacensis TaxID=2835305 RepID=UPI001C83B610|nr:hypothetical protein [Micromonospora tarapacensis]MBX7267329.1 hypothetical protein [Micromonospora tarapacensis]
MTNRLPAAAGRMDDGRLRCLDCPPTNRSARWKWCAGSGPYALFRTRIDAGPVLLRP